MDAVKRLAVTTRGDDILRRDATLNPDRVRPARHQGVAPHVTLWLTAVLQSSIIDIGMAINRESCRCPAAETTKSSTVATAVARTGWSTPKQLDLVNHKELSMKVERSMYR
eukprot:6213947-Pleurochrysis_carterae.AAC.5